MIFKTFDELDGAGNHVKGNALFWKANANQREYDKGQLKDFIDSQEKYFNAYQQAYDLELRELDASGENDENRAKAHKKAIASIEDANDVTKNYFKTMEAGQGTFEDFSQKQEKAFSGANKRVLKFSESTKAAFKSMGAELAIALAIQAGKALWNAADEKWALTAKTKIEHMEEAVNEYNDAVSSSSENISTIKSLSSEYERLAQGVDGSGRNIGLSAEEFGRYNQIVAELVGINPELIQGYTAEGNAIVDRNSVIQEGIALQEEYANAAKNTYASISTGQEILEGVQVNRNEVLKEMRGVGSDIYDVTAQAGGSSSFTWNVGAANGQYAQVQKYSTLVGEVLGRQIDLQNATASTYQDVAAHSEEILKTAKERNLFTQEEYETLKSSLAEMDSLSLEIDTATQPIMDWLNTAIDQTNIPEHMRDGFQAGLREISAQGLENNWGASKIKSEALELSQTLAQIYESNEDGYATALRKAEKAQEEFMDSDRLEADVNKYNDSIESNIDLIEDLAKKYEAAGDTITAAALYEEASNMADFAKENILTLAEAFNPLKDEIAEARNAKETFDAAMEGGDYHTAVNAYKEIYDEVIDGFDNAGNGTMAFWQAAEQMLGTDTLQEYGYDIDKVNAKIKSLSGLLGDSSTATSNFYQMLASNQELIDEGFVTLEEDGSISFDIDDSDLDTVADKLNISKELLTSFIDSARHWTDVDLSNTGQVESAIKEMEGTFKNDGVAYQFLDTVNSQAAAAGLSVAELDRKIKNLDSVKLIDITKFSKDDEIAEVTQQFIDMNSVLGSKDASGNFSMNADAIIHQMEGMGRTADETAEILERLSEKGWIDEDSFDMDKNQTWDDYVSEMYGTLESTDPFAGMVSSIDKGTVAINDLVIAIGGIPTDIDFTVNTDEVKSAVNQLAASDSYTKGDKAEVQGMIDAQRNRNNRLRENALASGYKEDSQYIKRIDEANRELTVTTYNGGTSLGSDSKSFGIKLRDSVDRPSVSRENIQIEAVPIEPNTSTQHYIQGKTQAKITITPTVTSGEAGAIKIYNVTVGDQKFSSSSNVILTDALATSGNTPVKVSVIDGRGMSSKTPTTKNINVLPYFTPIVANFSVARCTSDGTLNTSGQYVKVTFDYRLADCSGNNSATIVLSERESVNSNTYTTKNTWTLDAEDEASATITQVFGTYSVDSSFDFELTITDFFGASSAAYTDIGTEELLIDMSADGVAIGKVVERQNALEVEWDSYFEGTIYGTFQANTSDIRKKMLVEDDVNILLDIWDELSVVLFKYRDGDEKILPGLIAQDVISIFNAHELDWRDYGMIYEDPQTGFYSINYEFVNQLSMLKVRKVQSQLAELTKRVCVLEMQACPLEENK